MNYIDKKSFACLCVIADLGSSLAKGESRREIYLQWTVFKIAATESLSLDIEKNTTSTITELSVSREAPLRHIFATHNRPGLPPLDMRRAAPQRLLGSWCLFENPEPRVDPKSIPTRIGAVLDFGPLTSIQAQDAVLIQLTEECIPLLNALPDDIKLRALSSPEWKHLISNH